MRPENPAGSRSSQRKLMVGRLGVLPYGEEKAAELWRFLLRPAPITTTGRGIYGELSAPTGGLSAIL